MKKLAVLIGINQYPALPELKFARQDAEAVEQALKQNYCFSDNEILLMTDEKPGLLKPFNKQVIEKHLEDLANQELDLFIFGFWGHGLFRNGERFLCPLDVMNDQVEDLGLSFKELQRLFSNIKAKNTCLILDCCQKSSDRGETELLTEDDCSVMENCARDIVLRRKEKEPEFTSNIAILNSCKEGQCAYEWDSRKHGIFTAHLLDAMNRRLDSVAKIISYISSNVAKTALELGKTQTPFYKMEGDILLPTNTESAPLVTGDVFISFRHCNADLVAPVENELKSRGITYFIDRVGVNYGMEYSEAITKAIAACKVLLLIWTEDVKGSDDIVKEVVLALKLKKIVVPYKIGNFSEIDHQRLCYHIAHLSYYSVPQQTSETITELVNRIEQTLDRTVVTPIEDVTPQPSKTQNGASSEPKENAELLESSSELVTSNCKETTEHPLHTASDNLSQNNFKFSFKAFLIKCLWFILWFIGITAAEVIGNDVFVFILKKIFASFPSYEDWIKLWIVLMGPVMATLLTGFVMQWTCILPKWVHDRKFPGFTYGQSAASIYWIWGFISVLLGNYFSYSFASSIGFLGGVIVPFTMLMSFLWSREYGVYLKILDNNSISISDDRSKKIRSLVLQFAACSIVCLIVSITAYVFLLFEMEEWLISLLVLCLLLISLRCIMRTFLVRRYADYYQINCTEYESFLTKLIKRNSTANANPDRKLKIPYVFISLVIVFISLVYWKYYHSDANYYYNEAMLKQSNIDSVEIWDSIELLEKAAKRGHIKAMYQLGLRYKRLYEQSYIYESNEAFNWFKKAAKKGYAPAQFQLGCCYHDGFGVKKDLTEAFKWFQKAAAQNDLDAQFNLGLCYFRGDGVSLDFSEGIKWLQEAAKQGHRSAQSELGRIYASGDGVSKDMKTAIIWLTKSAEQGDAYSQGLLGLLYLWGEEGVIKDPKTAVKWLQKAAEQGNAMIQYQLGNCYLFGNGVEVNKEEAVKWYQKAAEQGYSEAQYFLGNRYMSGDGVEINQEEAVKWYRLSAEQDNIEAMYMLGICYMDGNGVEINKEEAVKWLQKSAEQGHSRAQLGLGCCYMDGLGVEKDFSKAKELFQKAKNSNDEDIRNAAQEALNRMSEEGY